MAASVFLDSSRDVGYSLRMMSKNLVFAVVAILTLALGIGANTAGFTVISAVLLKPLAYRDPDRLVNVSGGATPVRFDEMKAAAQSYGDLGAFTSQEDLTLTGGAEPEVLKATRVSAGFLRILGVTPVLGRGFLTSEDSPGGQNVVLISAELWQRRFGGDLHIAGKAIDLSGEAYTIVGVLPARFQFPFPSLEVWITRPSEWPAIAPKSRELSPFLTIFGRLKPGVPIEQATAEAALIQKQYAMSHPTMLDAKPKSPVRVKPLKDQIVTGVRSQLWMLFGAVGFVLLIACGNIASLLLARAAARSREFAIRSALGAARSRLIRQLLAESVLLSLGGGVCGTLFALWSLPAIRHLTTLGLPRTDEIHLDGTVLAFAATLSVVTGILFGLVPALTASRPDLIEALRARTGGSQEGNLKRLWANFDLRSILVTGQIALSIVLLIGAARLLETVVRLRADNPGFDSANVLTMRLSLAPNRYDTDWKREAFFDALLSRIESQPGVHSATAALSLPMTGFAGTPVQDAAKALLRLNERPIATALIVTPQYFETLKIAKRRGKIFTSRDRGSTQRVAIIDEGLARRFWPAYPAGLDPVGQHILIGGVNSKPAEIIGIVANVHQNVDNSAWPQSVYMPFAQNPLSSALLAIRTAGEPIRLLPAIREQVRTLDQDQTISEAQPMSDLIEAQLGQRSALVMLFGLFACVAVVLALIGVYGVIAYSVTQRSRELGIRRALGATERGILWTVVRQALALAVVGTFVGLSGAFALTRVASKLLVHVSATDPATFATVALAFILVAFGASYIPAWRATRVDPMAVLRYE